jgi:hypothetical protein
MLGPHSRAFDHRCLPRVSWPARPSGAPGRETRCFPYTRQQRLGSGDRPFWKVDQRTKSGPKFRWVPICAPKYSCDVDHRSDCQYPPPPAASHTHVNNGSARAGRPAARPSTPRSSNHQRIYSAAPTGGAMVHILTSTASTRTRRA